MRARPVLADEAEHIGLVLKTVDDDKLMDSVLEIALNIIRNSPIGIWLTKNKIQTPEGEFSPEQATWVSSEVEGAGYVVPENIPMELGVGKSPEDRLRDGEVDAIWLPRVIQTWSADTISPRCRRSMSATARLSAGAPRGSR